MRTTVCTGWGPAGWELYGRNFAETFHLHWPAEIGLIAYTEIGVDLPLRGLCRSLWDCKGAQAFYERHKDIPEHCGRAPVHGWKDKDKERGYAFRWDAVKWFRQILIPHDAAGYLPDGDILAWFDADVITFADVPDGFIDGMLAGADLVYIGRDRGDPELGFWAVRLNSKTRAFLRGIAECFTSDDVFKLRQWHSGHVFDHVLTKFIADGMNVHDLCRDKDGDVWAETPLKTCTVHLKGQKRKAAGFRGKRQ